MRQWMSALVISLLLLSSQAMAFDHSRWNTLLQQHVQPQRGGVATAVDYDGVAENREALLSYLDSLTAVTQGEFNAFSRDEKLAFLINAYNAFTVELILRENQPDSIRDIGSLFSSPWDKAFFSLLGESRTLDELEHEMIRGNPDLMDPRIHFAVNCASIGCPALRATAYTGEQLEAQLEETRRNFSAINNAIATTASRAPWKFQKFSTGMKTTLKAPPAACPITFCNTRTRWAYPPIVKRHWTTGTWRCSFYPMTGH